MRIKPLLTLAPAALGLLGPLDGNAAELNLSGINQYAADSQEQVSSINQFSDVRPTDWAYQALSNLIERYGSVAGYSNASFRGGQPITRYEAAALLNASLDRITETTDEVRKLIAEFQNELAVIKGRVSRLESRTNALESTQFSTTTKLHGKAFYTLGSVSYGGNTIQPNGQQASLPQALSFNYDVRLTLDTSFSGKDLLRTRLRAANYASTAFFGDGPTGLTSLDFSFQSPAAGDVVGYPFRGRDISPSTSIPMRSSPSEHSHRV